MGETFSAVDKEPVQAPLAKGEGWAILGHVKTSVS